MYESGGYYDELRQPEGEEQIQNDFPLMWDIKMYNKGKTNTQIHQDQREYYSKKPELWGGGGREGHVE